MYIYVLIDLYLCKECFSRDKLLVKRDRSPVFWEPFEIFPENFINNNFDKNSRYSPESYGST